MVLASGLLVWLLVLYRIVLYSLTIIIFAQQEAEHQTKQQTLKLDAAHAQLAMLHEKDLASRASAAKEKEQEQKNMEQVKRHLHIAPFTHCFLYTRPGTAHCQARSKARKPRRAA
jgi:hypothetical protein